MVLLIVTVGDIFAEWFNAIGGGFRWNSLIIACTTLPKSECTVN